MLPFPAVPPSRLSPQIDAGASILIVDDDQAVILAHRQALTGLGTLRFSRSGADALRIIREEPPDLVLLDADMPGMNGFEVCATIKADEQFAELPIIFVTSHSGAVFEESGFAAGAADFIAKPINPKLVVARVKTHLRLKRANEQLRAAALSDALTGLANRRAFDERLRMEWGRALRSSEPLSLLMLDVDHFKQYNDHYGHTAGDDCLRQVANTIGSVMHRIADHVARYGGEEFAMLLPSTDASGAMHVAAAIQRAFADRQLPHAASSAALHVTVSIGISALDKSCASWNQAWASAAVRPLESTVPADLIRAADSALYQAKRAGRARAEYLALASLHPARRLA